MMKSQVGQGDWSGNVERSKMSRNASNSIADETAIDEKR
jgi:hypothetical protein